MPKLPNVPAVVAANMGRWFLEGACRHLYAPALLVGLNGLALWVLASDRSAWLLLPLLGLAVALSFLAEQVLPCDRRWNRPRGDSGRDVVHGIVNESTSLLSIASVPLLAAWLPWPALWPRELPLAGQVLASLVVLDAGITLAHWLSHRWSLLWRFHAVHHSVERMYGFNGLMKHPVHQGFETLMGTTPLLLLGMPVEVAAALGFCTAVQLLLQHSNVDYELGPLETWLACNRVHRFHHVREPGAGDVNFGLFTTVWDRLLGTFVYDPARVFGRDDLGLADRRDYPVAYLPQLLEPFRNLRPVVAAVQVSAGRISGMADGGMPSRRRKVRVR